MRELVAALLAAMLASLPPVPEPQNSLLKQRYADIIELAAEAAEAHDVPPAILLATGFLETHLGTDHRSGSGWGAPISRTDRHTAGSVDSAASALQLGFSRCFSWRGAISHFRCGRCVCRRLVGYTAAETIRVVRAAHRRALRTAVAAARENHEEPAVDDFAELRLPAHFLSARGRPR